MHRRRGIGAQPRRNPTCAFVEFSELSTFPAHLVSHLILCDGMAAQGVDTTLYMLPPHDGAVPSAEDLATAYGLAQTPHIGWVPHHPNKWAARLHAVMESARLGRDATFTYSTRGLPTLGALLGGARRVVIEIHQPSVFWSRHDRVAFGVARRSRRLKIVCISRRLSQIVAREWHLDESRMIVEHMAHNFPIRDDYRAPAAGSRRLRALYVGSFDPGKGLQTLTELARHHPDVDFEAVGGQMDAADLPHNVTVRPRVAHSQVPDLLSSADLLLMPFSTYGGGGLPQGLEGYAEEFYSPLKMVEYLSAGRAIISSNLPSIAEVLVNESNALLVEPDSLPQWSEAVSRLERDSALRERLAHAAAHTARRHTGEERARRILRGIGVAT